ncbi:MULTISPECIES: TIR domain-containing protein [Rhizobium]|uniref:TIR domain-containing protein n=1 Tax=Rhizobium TaxID=379 RepID=UPI0007EBA6D7|nr:MULTISPECIES: TIR domain-containing protein [Rhizobium]UWU38824.1 toll/interleukin-1 receptor domain-containing protein [Rhizobium leguminosarum bv. phaseoli]ANK94034.1 queuine/other tRNA-ribosyltransferase protein [Rhizobium sp. N6212]ANL00085.1 queuine/other tRNA-ribosyltransferase protein [Rhizobium sp. N621]ANL06214.1 queuine/other tRNA-ribosyltransferase protein [Rhizobium esperanzae]ANL12379.1 queuine/other tRNA-ribosyltransferase protein [Rhizobium sp. N1341]
MADVYVIHSSKDNDKTHRMVKLLEAQWDVWWDYNLVGDYSEVIEREIAKAKCAVVIWSKDASDSKPVREEVRLAERHQVPIIPIHLDTVEMMYPFAGRSGVNFISWDDSAAHSCFEQLVAKISNVVPQKKSVRQLVPSPQISLTWPSLLLSVSSHETQLVPFDAVKALRLFGASAILVSAYDLLPSRRPKGIIQELRQIQEDGGFILIDSGNYEATRRGDDSWTASKFAEAMKDVPHDWAYCFDVMTPRVEPDRAIESVVRAVKRDRTAATAKILPIVHAPKETLSGYNVKDLPYIVKEVAATLSAPLIAVAERELGSGLIDRAKTVKRIRRELDKLPYYQPLHVLGTGNPWSIALLAAAGANSFDGLEWCRMVVDQQTHRLHHFQHFDFFKYQMSFSDSQVTLDAIDDPKIEYAGKVALHNLDYYRQFEVRLANAMKYKQMENMLTDMIGPASVQQIRNAIPDIFQ